jgi:MFS family permease
VALFGFAVVPGDASYPILASLMVVSGAGGGMFVAPNMSSIMNATPVIRRGVASGMSATLVTTGALLSLSLSFVVLATSVSPTVLQTVFAGEVPSGPNATSNIALFIGPMHTIFLIMGIMSLVAVVPSALRGQKFAGVPESKGATAEPVD